MIPDLFQAASHYQIAKNVRCARVSVSFCLTVSTLRRATDTCRASTHPPAKTRKFCSPCCITLALSSRSTPWICSGRVMPRLPACECCVSRRNANMLDSSDRLFKIKDGHSRCSTQIVSISSARQRARDLQHLVSAVPALQSDVTDVLELDLH